MDQQRKLPRILMVLTYAVATLDAVAASEFDLTGEPYDLIIRVSLQNPPGCVVLIGLSPRVITAKLVMTRARRIRSIEAHLPQNSAMRIFHASGNQVTVLPVD